MANKTDGEKGNTENKEANQGQQIERAIIAPDGTITVQGSEAKLESVDVAVVDLLLSFSGGAFVVDLRVLLDPLGQVLNGDGNPNQLA